jgi:PTS system N-acetylglucosamine-specific IIC component
MLTGVTEPIEFSFMFLAPVLFAVHAVLTGLSMALMNLLGVHLGFGFSAGLFDYAELFQGDQPLAADPGRAGLFRDLLRGVPLCHRQVRSENAGA